jgi:hypothetical protein
VDISGYEIHQRESLLYPASDESSDNGNGTKIDPAQNVIERSVVPLHTGENPIASSSQPLSFVQLETRCVRAS